MNASLLFRAYCFLLVGLAWTIRISADEAPANSELAVDQAFTSNTLDSKWHINTGKWVAEGGVLKASEIPSDQHSAAARFTVETNNAVYQLRFRLVGEGRGFHLGFDPAPGELDKKGHLFSVMVMPSAWQIMKHVDKSRREADPNEVLARGEMKFNQDDWHNLRVTTWGPYVTATVDGRTKLKANHPSFDVKKPTLVLRCLGDGVEIDDIKVWRQKK